MVWKCRVKFSYHKYLQHVFVSLYQKQSIAIVTKVLGKMNKVVMMRVIRLTRIQTKEMLKKDFFVAKKMKTFSIRSQKNWIIDLAMQFLSISKERRWHNRSLFQGQIKWFFFSKKCKSFICLYLHNYLLYYKHKTIHCITKRS